MLYQTIFQGKEEKEKIIWKDKLKYYRNDFIISQYIYIKMEDDDGDYRD